VQTWNIPTKFQSRNHCSYVSYCKRNRNNVEIDLHVENKQTADTWESTWDSVACNANTTAAVTPVLLARNQHQTYNDTLPLPQLLTNKRSTQRVQTPPRLLHCRPWYMSYKMPHMIRLLQRRPLVNDNISFKKCVSPSVEESENRS